MMGWMINACSNAKTYTIICYLVFCRVWKQLVMAAAVVDTAMTLTPNHSRQATGMLDRHMGDIHSSRPMDTVSLTINNMPHNTDTANRRSRTCMEHLLPTEECRRSKHTEDTLRLHRLQQEQVLGRVPQQGTVRSTITTKRLVKRSGKSLLACPSYSID
jgi:hypothetical protein